MLQKQTIDIASVRVPAKRLKTLVAQKVEEIAESILENGQSTPIQLRTDGAGFVLIEGFHRLEALKLLGETTVVAYLVQPRLH